MISQSVFGRGFSYRDFFRFKIRDLFFSFLFFSPTFGKSFCFWDITESIDFLSPFFFSVLWALGFFETGVEFYDHGGGVALELGDSGYQMVASLGKG